MNKEKKKKKSRAENQNQDIYEQEVLKQAGTSAVTVMMLLAVVFFSVQAIVGGGMNWGLWALVLSGNMATFWVKYIKLRRNHELVMAVIYTIAVSAMSLCHIYNLVIFTNN